MEADRKADGWENYKVEDRKSDKHTDRKRQAKEDIKAGKQAERKARIENAVGESKIDIIIYGVFIKYCGFFQRF